MGRYFAQDSKLASLERLMMTPPNFIPCGGGVMLICTINEMAGTPTLAELAQELIRPWDHIGLKRRGIQLVRRTGNFLFDGQLHAMRLLKLSDSSEKAVSSKWMAAAYLLSSSATLWQRTLLAITPGNINFDAVKLGDTSIRDYTLYRAAKGLYHGRLGVAADELADEELVSDNTLLMIVNAALIARFGPKVMEIGRNEDNV